MSLARSNVKFVLWLDSILLVVGEVEEHCNCSNLNKDKGKQAALIG